jgi:hypothetical protein
MTYNAYQIDQTVRERRTVVVTRLQMEAAGAESHESHKPESLKPDNRDIFDIDIFIFDNRY